MLARIGEITEPWGVPPHVVLPLSIFHDTSVQPLGDQPDDPLVSDAMFEEPDQPVPRDMVEKSADICVNYPIDLAPFSPDRERVKRIVRPPPGPEPVAEPQELRLIYRRQDGLRHGLLNNLVLYGRDAERSCSRHPALGMLTRRDGVAR